MNYPELVNEFPDTYRIKDVTGRDMIFLANKLKRIVRVNGVTLSITAAKDLAKNGLLRREPIPIGNHKIMEVIILEPSV